MSFEIRHAYTTEPDAVQATIPTLLSTIAFAHATTTPNSPPESTSPTRPARCLMLFDNGRPAGMAFYFYNYSTWRAKPGVYLEDLFVRPKFRGKGYGKRLLETLAKEVVKMDGGRLDWVVLKWNEHSIRFYQSIGAKRMDEWVRMRVDNEALVKLSKALD